MTAPELKPCPFCGGKPYLANVEMVGCAYVVCTDCRAQGDDASREGAIAAWNRRADLAAVPAQVRVKPLVWVDKYRPVASPQAYQIWPDNGGSGAPDDPIEIFDGFMLYSPTMMGLGIHSTIEAAKAAAQADYEARILAAIEPQPASRDAVIARLVEAADGLISYLIDKTESEIGRECRDRDLPVEVRRALAAIAAAKAVQHG